MTSGRRTGTRAWRRCGGGRLQLHRDSGDKGKYSEEELDRKQITHGHNFVYTPEVVDYLLTGGGEGGGGKWRVERNEYQSFRQLYSLDGVEGQVEGEARDALVVVAIKI